MKPTNSILLTLALASPSMAELKLPAFISDGMVLQQEKDAPVWGWADAGTKVSVEFGGEKQETTTNDKGRWMVKFSGLKASKEPADLTVTAGEETKKLTNVLVGEVWIASGQSNMEWTVGNTTTAAEDLKVTDPLLRVYLSPNIASSEPQLDFPGTWIETAPANTGKFTAVGYHFAKRLREELDVPVGIIECSWGGKTVQAFTSLETLQETPEAKWFLEAREKALSNYDPEKTKVASEKYQADLEAWQKEKRATSPRNPDKPKTPTPPPTSPATSGTA